MKKSEMWNVVQIAGSAVTIAATASGLLLPEISSAVVVSFAVAAVSSVLVVFAGVLRDIWTDFEEMKEYKDSLKKLENFYDIQLHRAIEFDKFVKATEKGQGNGKQS